MKLYMAGTAGLTGESMANALARVGLLQVASHARRVFVKPNFTFPRPVPGVTTTPGLLKCVLSALSETGTEVLVGESNGGYGSFRAIQSFQGHGLPELCKDTGATMIDLSTSAAKTYTRDVGGKRTTVLLPQLLAEEVDFTVSVPVLKVHAMTTVSLSVKNLWGCVPSDLRLLEHATISRKLALIARLVRARFGIVDATYGLDIHGPMEGTAREVGKFIAADDLYGLDWICAEMMGFVPSRIQHLKWTPRSTREEIGRGGVDSNVDYKAVNWGFSLRRDPIDTLSVLCFHNDLLAKLIFDSPLTGPIYRVLGRKPRRQLT